MPRDARIVVFSFIEIVALATLFCSINLASIGQTVWLVLNTPIGSFLGKVAAVAVATKVEVLFDACWPAYMVNRGLYGWTRRQTVFYLRYTDDVYSASKVWCAKCQKKPIDHMHKVSFETAEAGSSVNWVHLHIRGTDQQTIIVRPTYKNSPYIAGKVSEPVKGGTPP